MSMRPVAAPGKISDMSLRCPECGNSRRHDEFCSGAFLLGSTESTEKPKADQVETYSGPQRPLKLTQTEREQMLDKGRACSYLEDAKDAMFSFLLDMPWFSELDLEDLSSYAFAAAKFTHAKEYRESW